MIKNKKSDLVSVRKLGVSKDDKSSRIEVFASTLEAASSLSWGTYTGTITKDVFGENNKKK